MLLDIVALPPQKLRQKLVRPIVRVAKGYDTEFVVDNRQLIPHMSFFHLRTHFSCLPKIYNQVREVLIDYQPVKIFSKSFGPVGGSVGYRLTNNKALRGLNRKLVKSLYQLRTGVMPWTSKRKAKTWERENRRKYGTQHNIGKSFNPHFTMAYFKNEEDAVAAAKQLPRYKFNFLADEIAVCEVNYWHQVTKVLKRFRIK